MYAGGWFSVVHSFTPCCPPSEMTLGLPTHRRILGESRRGPHSLSTRMCRPYICCIFLGIRPQLSRIERRSPNVCIGTCCWRRCSPVACPRRPRRARGRTGYDFSRHLVARLLVASARPHGNLQVTSPIAGPTRDAWRLTRRRTIEMIVRMPEEGRKAAWMLNRAFGGIPRRVCAAMHGSLRASSRAGRRAGSQRKDHRA